MTFPFCAELDALYASKQPVGRTGRVFTNVGALSTPNNLLILRALMMQQRPEHTLEIGLSFGGSALAIAASHHDLNRPQAGQHIAIDPYQKTVWDDSAIAALERAGLEGYVEVRETDSALALPQLLAEQRRFGLIYVDGSHLFEDVFVDLYFTVRLLQDAGFLLFDDCANPHVAKVMKFAVTNWNGWLTEVDLTEYRPDGASLRYRLARQLGRTQLRAFRKTGARREWDSPFADF